MNFFLDTSICIDVLRTRGAEKSFELFKSFEHTHYGFVSVITVAELSAGALLSSKRDAWKKTDALLAHVQVIDLTEPVAFEAGKIYADLSRTGKRIEFNDCLIAATATSIGINTIVTRNCDHFNRIADFTAVVPEDLDF
jgi:predicted nucleic acid-binding protein